MRKIFTFIILLLIMFDSIGQVDSVKKSVILPQYDKASIGCGIGFPYGGFGANVLVYPQKNIGLFAGAGFAIAGFGYNVGTKVRMVSSDSFKSWNFYLTAMYGYNAAIKIENATNLNKLFYGATFGAGFDYKAWPEKRGYWNLAILVPVRGSDVDDYIDYLKTDKGVEFKNELLPIGISIGYRFIIN